MKRHHYYRWHALSHAWHTVGRESMMSLLLVVLVLVAPVAALSTRLLERSLFMASTTPGATTAYTVSFGYASLEPIGSVDMLFCNNPIPYMPCVKPTGLDVSNAQLSQQLGEVGFSILSQTDNHIILTRTPTMITPGVKSSYTLNNIVNPTDTGEAFSIRLRTHTTINATGQQVDFGSVRGQVSGGISLETQVPPMLIFCVAQQVEDNCTGTNDVYYSDMGQLDSTNTLTAQSQMAVGTNATAGFAITVEGADMASGTNVIDAPTTPTESKPGTNQFGINLVENNQPQVGGDPEGPWTNAVPTTDYGTANRYKYVPGDVVASAPHVSLMKKFTVSYILNSSEELRPGVYTTTVTYIASGRF